MLAYGRAKNAPAQLEPDGGKIIWEFRSAVRHCLVVKTERRIILSAEFTPNKSWPVSPASLFQANAQ